MSTILLSIKPEYVKKILNKKKKYEYRKTIPSKNVDNIIIYETNPIQKVVAVVEVIEIITDTPIKVWDVTNKESGITKDNYFKYYNNKSTAVAFKLGKIIIYKNAKTLNELGIKYAPQSYIYLD